MARYEWPRTPILGTDEASRRLAEALWRAWSDLEAERVAVLRNPRLFRRGEVDEWLREFQAAIGTFGEDVAYHLERFTTLHLAPQYAAGIAVVTRGATVWTSVHTTAFTSLALDTYGDFLRRSEEAARVSSEFARAVREAARAELPKGAAGGRTMTQAAERLEARLLGEYNITQVVYRNGARVPVDVYAQMAARTKSAIAYNAGTLNEAHSLGVQYVEVFDGSDCGWASHEDTDKANGSIRTVEEAAAHPIAHPNCQRAFGPRPDLSSPEDAAAASPTTTEKQREDAATIDWTPERQAMRTRSARVNRARIQARRAERQARLRARYAETLDPS